jgi:hypothetical protein
MRWHPEGGNEAGFRQEHVLQPHRGHWIMGGSEQYRTVRFSSSNRLPSLDFTDLQA